MDLSRRSFLGGALSLGALGCGRAFAAPAGLLSGAGAKLTLGVISDIHVIEKSGDFGYCGDASQFEKTLRWFDEQSVDGVVVAGDMADNGMVNQLEKVGEAWFRVFPGGKSARDGRPVEQLFVLGNHDIRRYDASKKLPKSFWICHNRAKAWRHVFKEDYAPIWFKTVKGYQFVGAHWRYWSGVPEIEPWFRNNAAKIDRTKPFFYIQHCNPRDTVYGAGCWSPDSGFATRALSAFPNAIAFAGHTHNPLTDERSIWQGAFTSVATASLRYGGGVDNLKQRQGMLVKVYDDRVVLVRRDFLHDLSLGDDWVIPLPACTAAEKPFAFETRAKKYGPPEFAAGAKPVVTREKEGWLVTIPSASATKTRSFLFRIDTGLVDKDGKPVVFQTWDAKYNMPPALAGAPTKYLVKDDRLPKGADGKPLSPKFTVTPLGSLGNLGKPIACLQAV